MKDQNKEQKNYDQSKFIDYGLANKFKTTLEIKNLSIDLAVKNWNFQGSEKTILGIFSNEEESLSSILDGLAGNNLLFDGEILLDGKLVTYNIPGWDREIAFSNLKISEWNRLFSIKHNLVKHAFKNKGFIQEISSRNVDNKAHIASLKNTGLSIDLENFKIVLLKLIKQFIVEARKSRNAIAENYEYQIELFHKEYARNKFIFPGSETLAPILVRKFCAEDSNIIANNNLLFLQSLQDRISSLSNLVGKCPCECKPKKSEEKKFQLKEITFVLNYINIYLNQEISLARKEVRTTLKSCNNYNQIYNMELNKMYSFKKIAISRGNIEQIIDQWLDLAETKRIKFNMRQDFLSMQLLPDEMSEFLEKIKVEIKKYHEKLLSNPTFVEQKVYDEKLKFFQNQLVDARDLVNYNINYIFSSLEISNLLSLKIHNLSLVQRKLIAIIQQIVVVTKFLILDNPFKLLPEEDKKTLANWLKLICGKLKIGIIFSSKDSNEISLLATDITVVENEHVIEQGNIENVQAQPLSLILLKEVAKRQLNIIENQVYQKDGNVFFYNNKLGFFNNILIKPIVAFKASDISFTLKKPFIFLNKTFLIKGMVKNIKKISDEESIITVETINNDLIEVCITNNNNYNISDQGWIIFKKNSIYVFDEKTKLLVGTW